MYTIHEEYYTDDWKHYEDLNKLIDTSCLSTGKYNMIKSSYWHINKENAF